MPFEATRESSARLERTPTRARLSLVLLLYFLGIIAVITLAPFRFALPDRVDLMSASNTFDVVANILLFVPLGFLYPLAKPGDDDASPWRVLVFGMLLSAAIETTQIFEPERYPSIVDVLTNGTGAAVGAFLVRAITRRIRVNAQLVGRLSLEIPLVGLIYILVPLLLVASMSAVGQSMRLLALLPLGFVGARLISATQLNHFGPAGLLGARAIAGVAGVWMLLGIFPVLLRYPIVGSGLVGVVMLTTWFESAHRAMSASDRRFEANALRNAAPNIAVYFLVIIFLPLAGGLDAWRFDLGLTGSAGDLSAQQIRLLEPVASLTVLGYLLAEARGRRELSFGVSGLRATVECAIVAAVIEISRGFQAGVGASAMQFLLTCTAGLLGAGIYHSQRDHVRWILAHRRDAFLTSESRGASAGHSEAEPARTR